MAPCLGNNINNRTRFLLASNKLSQVLFLSEASLQAVGQVILGRGTSQALAPPAARCAEGPAQTASNRALGDKARLRACTSFRPGPARLPPALNCSAQLALLSSQQIPHCPASRLLPRSAHTIPGTPVGK
jgi:hypothetical protein